jgi:hypothetical protein
MYSLNSGSIASVDHGYEGVAAARPGLQHPGHGLVPASTNPILKTLAKTDDIRTCSRHFAFLGIVSSRYIFKMRGGHSKLTRTFLIYKNLVPNVQERSYTNSSCLKARSKILHNIVIYFLC